MSRKVFLVVSVIVMLVLALVVMRFFREPMPVADPLVSNSDLGLSGNTVSGLLDQESVPTINSLPPTTSMLMSGGGSSGSTSGENLRVSEASPVTGDAPSQAATMARDSSTSTSAVTQPPSADMGASSPAPSSSPVASASVPVSSVSAPAPAISPTPPVAPVKSSTASAASASAKATAEADKNKAGRAAAPASGSGKADSSPVVSVTPASSATVANKVDKTSPSVPSGAPQKSQNDNPANATKQPGEEKAPAKAEAAAPKAGELITKSTMKAKAGSPTITSATLIMDGDEVLLRLVGDQALKGKTFLLKGPDRVVLDLDGAWRVETPRVPGNRMVGALRAGAQATTTRLVVDMKVTPGKAAITQVDANTLELRIR